MELILKESTHWYTYLGEPVECVPYSKPRREGLCVACGNVTWTNVKEDKSTCKHCKQKIYVGNFDHVKGKEPKLPDAKKYGLFPSVSKMASYGERPFELVQFKGNDYKEFIQACYDPDINTWNKNIQLGIQQFLDRYADAGSYIHGQVQKAMEGHEIDKTELIQRCTKEILDWCSSFDQAWESERGYCSPSFGLGGTIDLKSCRITADIKCKMGEKEFKSLKTDKWLSKLKYVTKQIAGYQKISRNPGKAYVAFVLADQDSPDAGECFFYEIPEDRLAWGLKAIQASTEAWMIDNEYDPRELFKQGLCMSLEEIMKGKKNE